MKNVLNLLEEASDILEEARVILEEEEIRDIDASIEVDDDELDSHVKAVQGTAETAGQVGGFCCYAG